MLSISEALLDLSSLQGTINAVDVIIRQFNPEDPVWLEKGIAWLSAKSDNGLHYQEYLGIDPQIFNNVKNNPYTILEYLKNLNYTYGLKIEATIKLHDDAVKLIPGLQEGGKGIVDWHIVAKKGFGAFR
jgi:hypothetical protein